MFHYLGIASHLREQVEKERKIGIKKIFYVIRPLLACEWIANRNSMPPTEFQKIFENTSIPNSARKETERLLEYKKTVKEGEEIELNNDFVSWLIDLYERNTTIAKSLESIPVHGWEPLNNLFLEQIGFSEFFNRD